ncbi:MAG: DUF768 domain-containing protein [Bauldia sp.]|nr:DUF768 domain-containing protein [Bauldia sp.]
MSQRFLRWVDGWIGDHVWPYAGADVEPYGERAAKLAAACTQDALAEGFKPYEVEEDAGAVPGLILKAMQVETIHRGDDLENG